MIIAVTKCHVKNINFIQVPLGLSFHAENSTTEIIQIIREIQDKYVPMMDIETDDEDREIRRLISKLIIESLLFGGDQLTEERIINAQQGFVDCRNAYEMLQGLKPVYEDWHLKRTLYEVRMNKPIFKSA